jgi:FAD/FMN-containing dehydrogenase
MRPFSDGSTYLNFPGFWEEGDALQQAAHGANYERLQAIKQQYDPQGLFARPAAATADTP